MRYLILDETKIVQLQEAGTEIFRLPTIRRPWEVHLIITHYMLILGIMYRFLKTQKVFWPCGILIG